MRRSSSSSVPVGAALLLVLVALMGTAVNRVSAELLALSVNATNAPPGLFKKAQANAAALLQKFVDLEGSDYTALAPGQTVPTDRMLTVGDESEAHENVNDRRRLFDCPNYCSNSGSISCQSMGCAYCGRCRRLLRQLQGNSQAAKAKHREVEDQLSTDISGYCNGKPDCTIRAVIQIVNDDGSLTPASL